MLGRKTVDLSVQDGHFISEHSSDLLATPSFLFSRRFSFLLNCYLVLVFSDNTRTDNCVTGSFRIDLYPERKVYRDLRAVMRLYSLDKLLGSVVTPRQIKGSDVQRGNCTIRRKQFA